MLYLSLDDDGDCRMKATRLLIEKLTGGPTRFVEGMRASLRRLVMRVDDEKFLFDLVGRKERASSGELLRAINVFKDSATQYRSVSWYLPFRVLLKGRWSEPVLLKDGSVFATTPQDEGGVSGLEMIESYHRRQVEKNGNLAVKFHEGSPKDMVLAERLKEASHGIRVEELIRESFESGARVPSKDFMFFVPSLNKDGVGDKIMLMPQLCVPLFCSRDRMMHSVLREDIQGLRMSPEDAARFASRNNCTSFALVIFSS